jgi:phosphoribosylformylglycinamidine cyclo-ligase
MLRTFNCGIGMVAVVAKGDAARARAVLERNGETVVELGEVIPVPPGAEQVQTAGALALS